jgi:hypothetical protein
MSYSYKDGRIWIQTKKFESYDLLLPYGMTGVTDPTGSLTAVREPSSERRRKTVIVDILRGEPGLPEFTMETRLNRTMNYLFGLGDLSFNVQCHMGESGRPDNYYSSEIMLMWGGVFRGDLALDRTALIEGDDAPDAISVPFSAEEGPILVDLGVEFLSARTIAAVATPRAIAFLGQEYFRTDQSQEDQGENGYAVFNAIWSSTADVYYTEDNGESWAPTSADPFAVNENISDLLLVGKKNDHRIIVSRGSGDGSSPAEIAYADVTAIGTTAWVTVNVGSVNSQYINKLFMIDYMHIYAITNDGYIYMSNNGGATWTLKTSAPGVDLFDIKAIGQGQHAGVIVVVGESNLIYLSNDHGDTWDAKTGPADGSGDNNLAVCITPDGTIYIGNDAGELYGSFDFCDEWTTLSAQGVTATAIRCIDNYGDQIIWVGLDTASGGRVVRSIDGGSSFRLWSLGIPTNGGVNDIVALDPNLLYVAADAESMYNTIVITRTTSNVIGI